VGLFRGSHDRRPTTTRPLGLFFVASLPAGNSGGCPHQKPAYHPQLLRDTGIDVEFNTIFTTIGWRNLVPINESGVKLLTMEFLCTLQILEAGAKVSFCIFNRQFTCT
jgi:hypothetical protein